MSTCPKYPEHPEPFKRSTFFTQALAPAALLAAVVFLSLLCVPTTIAAAEDSEMPVNLDLDDVAPLITAIEDLNATAQGGTHPAPPPCDCLAATPPEPIDLECDLQTGQVSPDAEALLRPALAASAGNDSNLFKKALHFLAPTSPTKFRIREAGFDNDDVFLGFDHFGNDLGYTHAGMAKGTSLRENNLATSGGLTTKLYSDSLLEETMGPLVEARDVYYSSHFKNGAFDSEDARKRYAEMQQELLDLVQNRPQKIREISTLNIDVTKFKGTTYGRFGTSLGVVDDGTGLPGMAADEQHAWHKVAGMYVYDNQASGGRTVFGGVQGAVGKVRPVFMGSGKCRGKLQAEFGVDMRTYVAGSQAYALLEGRFGLIERRTKERRRSMLEVFGSARAEQYLSQSLPQVEAGGGIQLNVTHKASAAFSLRKPIVRSDNKFLRFNHDSDALMNFKVIWQYRK